MTDQETKVPPTLAELEGKVTRLRTQIDVDAGEVKSATEALAKAGKSGSIEAMVDASSARETAVKASAKTESQLKTAQGAVTSAKYAVNADAIAKIHDEVRDRISPAFAKLSELGVTKLTVERSEETGKLVINSAGPNVKKARAPGSGGGGNRGTASWEVEGQNYTSRELIDAHLDQLTDKVREHYDSGNFRAFSMTREAEKIHAKLTGS